MMRRANLEPIDLIFFDLRLPIPSSRPFTLLMPKDGRNVISKMEDHARSRGPLRALGCVLGSAYLVVARRVHAAGDHEVAGFIGSRDALGLVAVPPASVR